MLHGSEEKVYRLIEWLKVCSSDNNDEAREVKLLSNRDDNGIDENFV